MIKRRYAFALALVICLTTTLLVVTSTGYDPWVDQDEDGDIDQKDLYIMAGEYGSTGNPTKNVSVTNWPEPQKPTFAEILVLRGYAHRLQKVYNPYESESVRVLVDENMPTLPHNLIKNDTTLYQSPNTPTEWDKQQDTNFTYAATNSRFFIQGEVAILLPIEHYFETISGAETAYYLINVYLEKVSPNATTILSSDYINGTVDVVISTHEIVSHGVILDIPSPVAVEPGERLRIRLETFARAQTVNVQGGRIKIFHYPPLGPYEFLAYIPILQP